MEETKKAVAIVHRYEMKADMGIQWNTMMYETFFAEEPRAVQLDPARCRRFADTSNIRLPAIVPISSMFLESVIFTVIKGRFPGGVEP